MTMTKTTHLPPRLSGPAKRPPGPAAASGVAGMTPRDFLRIVRKRKWMMILIWAICMGLALIITTLWYFYFPSYTAAALLRVNPPADVLKTAPMYPQPIIERYKRDQAHLIQARAIPGAIDDPRMQQTGWYRDHLRRGKDPVKELADDLSIRSLPDSSLLELSMMGRNKAELPNIVNVVARTAEKLAGEQVMGDFREQISKLKKERDLKQTELESIQAQMSAARGAANDPGIQRRQSGTFLKLQTLIRQVAEAQLANAAAQGALRQVLEAQQDGSLANSPEVQSALMMDIHFRTLSMQQEDLKTRLANLTRKFGAGHPQVRSAEGALEAVTQQLGESRKRIVANTIKAVVQSRKMEAGQAAKQLADLIEDQNVVQARVRDIETQLDSIENLKKREEMLRTSLKQINETLLGFEVRVRHSTDITTDRAGDVLVLVSPATEPRERSRPSWPINIALGVCLGLALAFGLAFLLELGDTSVRNPGDIVRRVDLPLLGMVPHGDDLDEDVEDFRRITLLEPHSPAAEAFRQIRTNLLFSGPPEQRKCLLVTSPAPEDGRTTVVTNLAASIAQAGHRVLIVDANFRQAAMAEIFPDAKEPGLSSALVGQGNWRDAVSATGVPNCDVIAAGPLPPNPAELFGSKAMEDIIAEMKAEYDQIFIDGPPVMVVSDAVILATKVDAVLLVVRAHANSVGIVQRAVGQLRHVGAHVLGTVLQGVRTTAGGYLRKNYQTFYEYHQRPLP